MKINTDIALLETIFADWKSVIGADYLGYRNHVYRMVHCCFALQDCSAEESDKIIIAAVFHDLGIWIDQTLDYIGPSLPPALRYLSENGLEAWSEEISLMISEHHKLNKYTNEKYPLVELFRKADLVDFSLGLVRFGLPKAYLSALNEAFPNEGFHKGLVKKAGKWFLRHPFNPAPMMKW